MKNEILSATSAAALRLLRPLVRVLLRNGIPYGAFADLAKTVYVDVASREFGIPGRKLSDSRVSVITGLTRKEVHRIKTLPAADDHGAGERYNRAARVIAGWVRDERYRGPDGEPAALPLEGDGPTFVELVRKYSGDVPARAVIDELVRVGAVERRGDGSIRLLARAYIPQTGEVDKIGILGTDVAELVTTIDHNLRRAPPEPFFQRKVSYDNLPEEAVAELRRTCRERCQDLLETLDKLISRHDRDVDPAVRGTGRKRVGVGLFYFEGDEPPEGPEGGHG